MRNLALGILAGAFAALAIVGLLSLYQPRHDLRPLHNPYWPYSVEVSVRDR